MKRDDANEMDVGMRCRITREEVPLSHGAAFVLVATNDWPLRVGVVLSVTAKNAIVSRGGAELERGPEVQLDNVAFSCTKKRKTILVRIEYLDPTQKLGITYKAHLGFDTDPKSVQGFHKYGLPIRDGVISQGTCSGSHVGLQSRWAYDFATDVGTEVLAARAGTVLDLVDCHETDGELPNKLLIVHADETVAVYGHLQHQGVLVKRDDEVEAGQLIALTGNSGRSSGPHLHFHVAICTAARGWVGLPIKFVTDA
jgi:murein DD-endopeptidase MepM/ murein hydrolase activator NlpD